MARMPRVVLAGQPHHVIQRGNNRSATFYAESDYGYYLECLNEGSRRYHCQIHAYICMTNHVHLLISPEEETGLSRLMQWIGRHYVRYVNNCYRRTGTLWEGRYKSTLVETERYVLTCYRYIELNPVRAGMVNHPGDYRWSSYHGNVGLRLDPLLSLHSVYSSLGANREEVQHGYQQLFEVDIDTDTLKKIRGATQSGWVLGNDRFKKEIETMLERRVTPKQRGGDRKSERYRRAMRRA